MEQSRQLSSLGITSSTSLYEVGSNSGYAMVARALLLYVTIKSGPNDINTFRKRQAIPVGR